jgi:hypothetical protein
MSQPCWAWGKAVWVADGRRNVLGGEGGLPDHRRAKLLLLRQTCTRGAVMWEAQAVDIGAESRARALGAVH